MTNLVTEVARLKQELAQVKKGQRLSHGASVENAAIEVRDEDGSLRAIVGQQGDGTTGAVIVNGPPPPQPSAPIVAPVIGGVTASWDALFDGGAVMPLDWARIEVHASTAADFTPDPVTLQSTIETAQGATVVIPCETDVYVRFLARSTSGTASPASVVAGPVGPAPVVAGEILDGIVTTVKLADDAVTAAKVAAGAVGSTAIQAGAVLEEALHDAAVSTGKLATDAVTAPKLAANSVIAGKIAANAVTAATVAAGAITTDKITVSGGGNMLADPGFEGPYTDALVSGDAYWSVDATKGNGSNKSLRVSAVAATPTNRDLTLFDMPIQPGDQLYLAIDYQASTDYAGTPRIYARWENSSGGFLSTAAAQASPPVLGATWQRISATVTAPANAARVKLNIASTSGTAGTIWFDNASVRPVAGGTQIADGAITTAKIVAGAVQTLQLDAGAVNAAKIASGAVTTAKLDALAVTADKIAANSITTGKLAAGSVDATALKADAITGKTITGGTVTGATIRTAATGSRIVLDTNHLAALDSGNNIIAEFVPEDDIGRSAFKTYDTRLGLEYYGALTAGDLRFGVVGVTSEASEGFVSYSSLGSNRYELLLSSGRQAINYQPGQINLYASNSSTTDSSHIDLNAASTTVTGKLTAGNHAFGQTSITPSAAHTPTSSTVLYNITGANFYGQATANTTVPGVRTPVGAQGVTGVGVSNATSTSMMVWVNRENATATNVNWEVWGS
ncbi:hypothetical protein E6R18_25005 [Streptomyces sp. A1277]|uniref:hypothetical protein n=1 Tax=Streptomyces sp. A1277 TaxID=2563103 RepID=UPI0010A2A620|nr:hypothetical protein [Streptomyces sp. A1277]THA29173.1 hypothetical protein E6R18_25005 [Streptomyces sp. A1277]